MEMEGPWLRFRYHCGRWTDCQGNSIQLIAGVNAAYITIMFLQLFIATAEFATLMSLTTFLTRSVMLSDALSSVVYGTYGAGTLLWSLVGGPVIDRMGFKVIMIFGCFLGAAGRILAGTLVFSPIAVGFCITCLVACGDAWTNMALVAATKNYIRNEQLLKMLFGVNYGVMNIGAIAAGALFDAQWIFPKLSEFTLVIEPKTQSLFIIAGIIMSAAFIVSLFLPRVPPLPDNGTEKRKAPSASNNGERLTIEEEDRQIRESIDAANPILPEHSEAESGGWLAALTSKSFWRVALFSILCLGARTIFLHVNATFPTVLRHLYGPDAPIGALYMINPLFITFLAPMIQIMAASGYTMPYIIIGTFICSLSPLLFMAAAPSSMGLAAIVLFSVILSIGEAMWGPLARYYITYMAGPKLIGTYLTMLSIIQFIPMIPLGYYSSFLLETFCPGSMTSNCQVVPIATIITSVSLVTPILLMIFVKTGILLTPKPPSPYMRIAQGRDQEQQRDASPANAAEIPLDDDIEGTQNMTELNSVRRLDSGVAWDRDGIATTTTQFRRVATDFPTPPSSRKLTTGGNSVLLVETDLMAETF